jgi:hypothetical protein
VSEPLSWPSSAASLQRAFGSTSTRSARAARPSDGSRWRSQPTSGRGLAVAGAGGALLNGSMRVLGRCTGSQQEHCTSVTGATELLLVPPVAGGQPVRVSTFGADGDGQPEDGVDWQALCWPGPPGSGRYSFRERLTSRLTTPAAGAAAGSSWIGGTPSA